MQLRYRNLDKKLSSSVSAFADTDFRYDTSPILASALMGLLVTAYFFRNNLFLHGLVGWLFGLILVLLGAFAGVIALGVPFSIVISVLHIKPVSAPALRKLADENDKLTAMEADYCRTVAVLVEQDRLPNATGKDVLGALNTLLQGSRRLDERLRELDGVLTAADAPSLHAEGERLQAALNKEADPSRRATLEQLLSLNQTRQSDEGALLRRAEHLRLRQQVIQQTFVSLRGTLLRTRLAQQQVTGDDLLSTDTSAAGSVQNMQELVTQLQQQVRSVEKATEELLAVRIT